MALIPGIEWPTAIVAVILSVILSLLANVLKSEILRWRKSRIETRQEEIDWYQEVLRISASLHMSTVASHSILLGADELVRSDMEKRAVRLMKHIADTEGMDESEMGELEDELTEAAKDIDNLEERYRSALLEHYEPYKDNILEELFSEAEQTYDELRKHYISRSGEVDDEVEELIITLLTDCFYTKSQGEMTLHGSKEIKDVSAELASKCRGKIESLQ